MYPNYKYDASMMPTNTFPAMYYYSFSDSNFQFIIDIYPGYTAVYGNLVNY